MTARRAMSALVIALAVWASWAFVFLPLFCRREQWKRLRSSYAAFDRGGEQARAVARANIERLERCLRPGCREVRLLFIVAINYRTIGRPEIALDLYRQALRYDRRPEILANIADTQLSLGNREEAYANYLEAVLFFPGYLRLVEDGALRARVRDEALRRRPDLEREIRRADLPNARPRWF